MCLDPYAARQWHDYEGHSFCFLDVLLAAAPLDH